MRFNPEGLDKQGEAGSNNVGFRRDPASAGTQQHGRQAGVPIWLRLAKAAAANRRFFLANTCSTRFIPNGRPCKQFM